MNHADWILSIFIISGISIFLSVLYRFFCSVKDSRRKSFPSSLNRRAVYVLQAAEQALLTRQYQRCISLLCRELKENEEKTNQTQMLESTQYRTVLLCCLSIVKTAQHSDQTARDQLQDTFQNSAGQKQIRQNGPCTYCLQVQEKMQNWVQPQQISCEVQEIAV